MREILLDLARDSSFYRSMQQSIFIIVIGIEALSLIGCGGESTASASSSSVASSSASTGGAGGAGGSSTSVGSTSTSSSTTNTATSSSGAGGSTGSGGAGACLGLHADFEGSTKGTYTQAMVVSDFGGVPPWNNGLDQGRATIVGEGENQFLRVKYTANQYGPSAGGVQFKVPLKETYQELYLSYRVRFAAGFDFVKGGKLPGLVGGSAPTGCVNDTTGFSARMMWRNGGSVMQYMYFPEKQDACGDNYSYQFGGANVNFTPGTWHTVEHWLVMNTPGEHDGVLQAWFDGKPALDNQAFLYRLAGATYAIDALYFSTFYGGGDSTWAPTSEQTADFDEFCLSTTSITH